MDESSLIKTFLAGDTFAVAGASRDRSKYGNKSVRAHAAQGYEVFPVNPNAKEIEGDPCYANVSSIPEGVDGVVIATQPKVTDQIVRECAEAGISRVWMHRSFGGGSVSPDAVDYCRANNITVIPGGCPMMFCEPVDTGHKCIRWILNLTGGLPKQV